MAGGIGVVGVATFAVFAAMAKSTFDNLESERHGPCSTDHADQVSSGKTQQLVANVALAVGVAGAAGGITLFVLGRPAASDARGAAIVIAPAWLGVRGAF